MVKTLTSIPIILDTDIGPDCDDVGAISVLHALANNGETEILGIMCCTSSQWGAPCINAIKTYYVTVSYTHLTMTTICSV